MSLPTHLVAAVWTVGFVLPSLPAQDPVLLADINKEPLLTKSGPAEPGKMVQMGSDLYFVENEGSVWGNGALWCSQGTPTSTRLVKDFGSFKPYSLTVVGSTLFFAGFDAASSEELWISDGTAAGTKLVKDIAPGIASSYIGQIAAISTPAGRGVVFAASDGSSGRELWFSDGTAAGTRLVKDIEPGAGSSFPTRLTPNFAGSLVFFAARTTNEGLELWVTDGTPSGTKLVQDITAGPGDSDPSGFVAVLPNRVYFGARTPAHGHELWVTTGTSASTHMVADINPGSGDGVYLPHRAVVGTTLYFRAYTQATGWELWKTDGTAAGTVQVADIKPGPGASWPSELVVMGTKVYFRADGGAVARDEELWVTDGTASGTKQVKDINPSGSSSPGQFAVSSGKLFFCAKDQAGHELWVSDGTANGTHRVVDIRTGPESSSPANLTALSGGRVLFGAFGVDNIDFARSLWVSDGTARGTMPAHAQSLLGPTQGSNPWALFRWGDRVLFRADDGVHGPELWASDGTPEGTKLLVDVNPGKSPGSPHSFAQLGNRIVFSGVTALGREPMITDGTASGTQVLRDIAAGAKDSGCTGMTEAGGKVYFSADDGHFGHELWVTDGTRFGTKLVTDIYPGSFGSTPSEFVALDDGRVLFRALDSIQTGWSLWISDGTAQGTQLVSRVVRPQYLTKFGAKVLFKGNDQLWITDGTAAGTKLVANVSFPASFAVRGSKAYFGASTSATGYELFETDGTAAGTKLVADIVPGPGHSNVRYVAAIGSRHVYFQADVPGFGTELWRSDGTAAGTKMLKEIIPGSANSFPSYLTPLGSRLLFAALDPVYGDELFVVDNGGTAETVGKPCGRQNREPSLSITDPVIGRRATLTGSDAPANVPALRLAGFASPGQRLPSGCDSYIDLGRAFSALPFFNAGTSWSVSPVVPNDQRLVGAEIAWQVWYVTSANPQSWELTNGVVTTIGRY